MTAVTDDRERELEELAALLAERGQQKPPPVPAALHWLAERGTR